MNPFVCPYLEFCSGCSDKIKSYQEQCQKKTTEFKQRLLAHFPLKEEDFDFIFPSQGYHRDRHDFISFENQMGLYSSEKKLIPIPSCALLEPELNQFYQKIRQVPFNVKKGTVRIRKSYRGAFGVWLDFANVDIKRLLDEKKTLQSLLDQEVVIEMGQRGKRVKNVNGILKLTDPDPEPWFVTTIQGVKTPLFSLIASFTQPSQRLNILMQERLRRFLEGKLFQKVVEYGAGVGNFSLFLSEFAKELYLIENDPRNLTALNKNIETFLKTKAAHVISKNQDYQKIRAKTSQEKELIFVNPPKSGVGTLFDKKLGADEIIYVSCYLDSMIKDLEKLQAFGYRIKKSVLFDQFPQSNHYETLTYLSK